MKILNSTFFPKFRKFVQLLPKFDQLLPKFGQLLPILAYKVTFSKIKSDLINGPRCTLRSKGMVGFKEKNFWPFNFQNSLKIQRDGL